MLDRLLAGDYMPHGHCYVWEPSLLWLHVGADAAIGLAYFTIPVALWYFVRRRPGANLGGVFLMFAAFILFCGATHFYQIVTVWQPLYLQEGLIKVLTAGASVFTAVALWQLMPRALSIPSPADLQQANEHLRTENAERRRAETELRELNEQLEAKVRRHTEELEQFIYAASHDLREPLRQLGTYAGFLRSDLGDDLPERAGEDLHFLSDAAERMDALVNALLGLSRAGRQELDSRSVAVADCIERALANLNDHPRRADAMVGDPPDGRVRADPVLLTTLYQNLIDNAFKYAEGPPQVAFTCEAGEGEVILGVRDHGIGIDPDRADRVFEPFFRGHPQHEVPGSGIGLSMARRIVERHGGRIWVEPTEGGGAHVRFSLPRGEEPEHARG